MHYKSIGLIDNNGLPIAKATGAHIIPTSSFAPLLLNTGNAKQDPVLTRKVNKPIDVHNPVRHKLKQ